MYGKVCQMGNRGLQSTVLSNKLYLFMLDLRPFSLFIVDVQSHHHRAIIVSLTPRAGSTLGLERFQPWSRVHIWGLLLRNRSWR